MGGSSSQGRRSLWKSSRDPDYRPRDIAMEVLLDEKLGRGRENPDEKLGLGREKD